MVVDYRMRRITYLLLVTAALGPLYTAFPPSGEKSEPASQIERQEDGHAIHVGSAGDHCQCR